MAFYVHPEREIAIAQIPKAGINTFTEWLRGWKVERDHGGLQDIATRVAFIRHPIDRIGSAFRHHYWEAVHGVCRRPLPSGYEDYVDHVLTGADDEHWRPQMDHVGEVPNVFHRFEDLDQLWERYWPGVLPHNNRTSRVPLDVAYRISDLLDYYAADYRRWLEAA